MNNNSENGACLEVGRPKATLNGTSPDFEHLLAQMSAAVRSVSPGELDAELRRWLEQFAQQTRPEQNTGRKFHATDLNDGAPAVTHDEIIGNSPALHAALAKAAQVAPTNSTVLITGETGTGKELLARAIHRNSNRRDKRMIIVNCAALPSNLVEAELFGREKGAYTGALTRERGRFEIADGSTILLDEIGELPLELQVKLLRVLQDGEFERIGSSKTLKVDVRVLAATNRNLAKSMEEKKFREDLFYRLAVFPIEVPPLRDRAEDIPQLVWSFVQEYSQTMAKLVESIPRKSMRLLVAHSWPGNVRELKNVIERAMIVSQGSVLDVEPPVTARAPRQSSLRLEDIEREHIRAIARSTGWRVRGQRGAAEILGLKPTTLEARMKKLGISRNEEASAR